LLGKQQNFIIVAVMASFCGGIEIIFVMCKCFKSWFT